MIKKTIFAAVLLGAMSTCTIAATPKDTLVIGSNIEDIVALDPAEAYEFSSGEIVANIYQNLVHYNPQDPTHVIPAIARSWTVSEDGKSLTFTLEPGLKFESGHPVRVEDVIFSYQRVLRLNKAPAFILGQLGWDENNIEQMVTKIDDSQLSIRINADVGASFALNILAARPGAIVDEKTVLKNTSQDDLGNAYLNRHSAGSGPYKLMVFKPKEALVLQANPHTRTAPQLSRVMVRNIPEPATQRLMLESGDIDIARNLSSDQLAAVKNNPKLKVEAFPQAAIHFVALNQKKAELQNPALWEAMRYLIDYQGISENIAQGSMRIHQGFLPEGFQGALQAAPYSYDPEKARAILEQAGISQLSLTLDVINASLFMDMAQSIQASFAKGGIQVKLNPGTGSQIITRYRARQHDSILLYWSPDFFDPHSNAKSFAYNVDNADTSYQSTTAWRNAWLIPELSAQTMAALREKDPDTRTHLYQTLQTEFQRQSPVIIGFQEVNQVAMVSNLAGYAHGLIPDLVSFYNVTK